MAAPPKLRSLNKESYPDAPDWFDPFLDNLGQFVTEVSDALDGGLDGQNIQRQVETFTLTTRDNPADTFSGGKVSVKCKLGRPPVHVFLSLTAGKGANLDYSTETWTAPTLLNGWGNYDTVNFNAAGYKMMPDGWVHLKGIVSGGAVVAGTPLFTLPAQYRPSKSWDFPVVSNGAFGQAQVKPNGDVCFVVGSATWFCIDNLSFESATGSGIGTGLPQWEYLQNGLVRFNYIAGLRPNTKYDVTVVLE